MVSGCLVTMVVASPTAAMRVQKSWELRMAEWNGKLQSAVGPVEQAKVLAEMPDAKVALDEMWQLIGGQLDQEWVLEPAAWYLRTAYSWQMRTKDRAMAMATLKQIGQVRKAVELHHVKSPGLLSMCVALAASPDQHSVSVLETISKQNPDEKIQGAASLGCAMLLGQLGDDAGLMQRRITHLRKAIIQSVDVDFGGRLVADLAKDELYVIMNLAKGREAPDLTGSDAAGRPISLSDYQGKIVFLVFWSTTMPEREHVMQLVAETKQRFAGKPLEVIGVCGDPLATLRAVEADGSVTWRNFADGSGVLAQQYRIGSRPYVYVLDQQRRVQFSGMPGSFADLTCDALLGVE